MTDRLVSDEIEQILRAARFRGYPSDAKEASFIRLVEGILARHLEQAEAVVIEVDHSLTYRAEVIELQMKLAAAETQIADLIQRRDAFEESWRWAAADADAYRQRAERAEAQLAAVEEDLLVEKGWGAAMAESNKRWERAERTLKSVIENVTEQLFAAEAALAAAEARAGEAGAVAWDEGHAAAERDWRRRFIYDLATPDEDRQPLTNPYRERGE